MMVALYCYTGHVKAVVEHLKKKNPLVDITLLSNLEPVEIRKAIPDESIKIEWYDVPGAENIKNRWLRTFVIRYRQNRFFAKFSKYRHFDIVNVHFPKRHLAYAYKYLRAMSDNFVITPWGSDILRQNEEALKQLKGLYKRADYIATSITIPLGKKIIEQFDVSPNRFVGNFFGSDVIDFAIRYGESITQEECKHRFGLDGRYVITCGYNRKVPQRHTIIIEAISQIRDRLPDNLTLLFPMTYANPRTDYDYIQKCKQLCKEKEIPAVFVTDYLSAEDVYKLRKSTDIFVHIQTTDAESGSVQEYIICDKKIVHGSWIKYENLEAFRPLFYFPVDRLENLGECILNAYNSEPIKIPEGVKTYISGNGWDNKSSKMNDFFTSIVYK